MSTDPVLVIRRVWIEPAECTGHTLCHYEVPDLIDYDPAADVSVVKPRAVTWTREPLQQLLEAEAVCPMNAFFIETEDGKICNASDDWVQALIHKGAYRWADSAT